MREKEKGEESSEVYGSVNVWKEETGTKRGTALSTLAKSQKKLGPR